MPYSSRTAANRSDRRFGRWSSQVSTATQLKRHFSGLPGCWPGLLARLNNLGGKQVPEEMLLPLSRIESYSIESQRFGYVGRIMFMLIDLGTTT